MNIYRKTVWFTTGMRHYTRAGYERATKTHKDAFAMEEKGTIDMSGKVAVVTGANRGLGYEVAMGLASRGATVHLCCRSEGSGIAAREAIIQKTGNPHVHAHTLDISDPTRIKTWVEQFSHDEPACHILVHSIAKSWQVACPKFY